MEQAAYRAEAAAVDQMIFVANSLPTDTGKQTDDCLAMRDAPSVPQGRNTNDCYCLSAIYVRSKS